MLYLRRMNKSLLIASLAFVLFSCKEDITPSWLEIPAINLTTDEPVEGANSHGIEDAWVYMDGKPLGVFELPCKIPILAEGEHAFIIYAGIKDNGISATRVKYPFYNRVEMSLTLVKGETISITPTVTYKNNLEFVLIEDFEAPGMYFENSLISQTDMVFLTESEAPDIVQYGFRCGAIYLNETDSVYKGQTSKFMDLPKNEDVYLEFDVMNNNTLVASTIAQNSSDYVEHVPLAGVNPQQTESMVWKKLYVPLIENVSWEIYATSYEIYLLSILDAANTSASIYLDNIKVICYQ
jgi:hypothetical protein